MAEGDALQHFCRGEGGGTGAGTAAKRCIHRKQVTAESQPWPVVHRKPSRSASAGPSGAFLRRMLGRFSPAAAANSFPAHWRPSAEPARHLSPRATPRRNAGTAAPIRRLYSGARSLMTCPDATIGHRVFGFIEARRRALTVELESSVSGATGPP